MAPKPLHGVESSACGLSEKLFSTPRGRRYLPVRGHDWGWTKDRLRDGVSPEELEIQLAAARPDKRDPADYAKRTVSPGAPNPW